MAIFEFLGGGCIHMEDTPCGCRQYELNIPNSRGAELVVITTTDNIKHYFINLCDVDGASIRWIEVANSTLIEVNLDVTSLPFTLVND